jgi:hypothetical protein
MSFDQFPIHWRFDDDSYNQLNQIHLDQIKPMTPQASNFLWNYSSEITKNLMKKRILIVLEKLMPKIKQSKNGYFVQG